MQRLATAVCLLPLLAAVHGVAAASAEPASPPIRPPEVPSTDTPKTSELQELLALAREHAPEVVLGRAALSASRSSLVSARLLPLGNPFLELKAERATRGMRDVAISGELWLPIEISGQRGARRREANDFVALHEALLTQARAVAMGRTVQAYGACSVGSERLHVLAELLTGAHAEARYYGERVAAGDATERDAALAAVEAARHEVMLSEAKAELIQAQGALRELTGRAHVAGISGHLPRPQHPGAAAPATQAAPALHVLAAQARYYGAARDRLAREAASPLSVGVLAGRGDLGETRLGGGLGYNFAFFRANQPERARADAERVRALSELSLRRDLIAQRLQLIQLELAELRRAVDTMTSTALPAAERAVQAASETQRAGKGDWLTVLVSRRDLSALSLRRLELLEKSWELLSEIVELTGDLP